MTIDERLMKVLRPICASVSKNVCKETPKPNEYIVHDEEDEDPDFHAGDGAIAVTYYRRVHYFTKGDPGEVPKKIRQAMRSAGFVITGKSEAYENDTGYTHVIVYGNMGSVIKE